MDSQALALVASSNAREFAIGRAGLSIGRDNENDVVIDDPEVSRHHARVWTKPDGSLILEDYSANGTFVNGVRVTHAELYDGDKVRFALRPNNEFAIEPAADYSRKTFALKQNHAAAPQLQVLLNDTTAAEYTISTSGLVLGSGKAAARANFVTLLQPGVAPQHAEIRFSPERGPVVKDLGSAEGTFVNGKRIDSEVGLFDGDLIRLGPARSHALIYRDLERRHLRLLRDFDLTASRISIGSDDSNVVILDHPSVSRFHAVIRRSGANFEIEDAGSTNGTWINGVRLHDRRILKLGDRILVGAVQLAFGPGALEQQTDGRRMELCASCITVAVRDATGTERRLLSDISLVMEPGDFVGLLGPSGCGKTTLLKVLSGQRKADQGKVLVNRSDLHSIPGLASEVAGFVPQDDVLYERLTVYETLLYTARLRMPEKNIAELHPLVTQAMESVEMAHRADSTVATLSGGQRKRVSTAMELLNLPGLLFLDEPTAGQDARTERQLMQVFRSIANRGATVLIATHLLNSMNLLTKIAVLVKGELAYYGPPSEALAYFRVRSLEDIYDALESSTPEEGWANRFRQHPLHAKFIAAPIGDQDGLRQDGPGKVAEHSGIRSLRVRLRQFAALLSRQTVMQAASARAIVGAFFPTTVLAALIGLLSDTLNNPKTLFLSVVAGLWIGASACVREIVDEAAIYARERRRNLALSAYIGSKLAYAAGFMALQALIFSGVLFVTGAQEGHFLAVWMITSLITLQGALLGLLVSALAPDPKTALTLLPMILIPQILLAGSIIPIKAQPVFFVDSQAKVTRDLPKDLLPSPMHPVLGFAITPFVAARWGLEALAEVYAHDYSESLQPPEYSYEIVNSIFISRHPGDLAALRKYTDGLLSPSMRIKVQRTPSALGGYIAILLLFAVSMTGLLYLAMVRKHVDL